jgi:hypothetical protein
MGPTSPTLSLNAEEMSESQALQEYSIACHMGEGGLGRRAWLYRFLMGLTPAKVLQTSDDVAEGYFTDPQVKARIKSILSSRLFYIVVFHHGAGWVLVDMFFRIVSHAWSPNPNENPGDFPVKVTLLPYDWDRHQLFHGGLHAGWVLPRPGAYVLDQYNADHKRVNIGTTTIAEELIDGDLYQNQSNFKLYRWQFSTGVSPASASVWFQYNPEPVAQLLSFERSSTFMDEYFNTLIFDEVWASTKDKSARCQINSYPACLTTDFTFAADGSGSGFMDIKNVFGTMTHYEYTQYANGHGYWTKNGGKKHKF